MEKIRDIFESVSQTGIPFSVFKDEFRYLSALQPDPDWQKDLYFGIVVEEDVPHVGFLANRNLFNFGLRLKNGLNYYCECYKQHPEGCFAFKNQISHEEKLISWL